MTARRSTHAAQAGVTAEQSAAARTIRPRPPVDGPAFLSITDAAAMLGISRTTLYRAVSEGQFPAVRIRDRVIVPAKAIEAMTDEAIDGFLVDGPGSAGGSR